MTNVEKFAGSEVKQDWVRPELQRIAAGSAESRESGTFDAGLADQGS